MAETMPDYAFTDINLLPELGMNFARSEGGLIITSRRSDPFWTGELTTRELQVWDGNNEHASFLAFLSRCVDLNLLVDFVHPRHRLPVMYTEDNWPLTVDPSLETITDLRNIIISGLEDEMVLKRGDRLTVKQGNHYAHRWLAADVTVDNINTPLEITPRLPIGIFSPGADVIFENPVMRLRIVPGSWDAAEAAEPTAISFGVEEAIS